MEFTWTLILIAVGVQEIRDGDRSSGKPMLLKVT
jgi:hypothetical protein